MPFYPFNKDEVENAFNLLSEVIDWCAFYSKNDLLGQIGDALHDAEKVIYSMNENKEEVE